MSRRVVHFEVPFDDEERARGFYGDVFGWQTTSLPDMGGYVIAATGPTDEMSGPSEPGFINGGMFKREAPWSGPMITIDVDDISATLEQVVAHGGTIVQGSEAVGQMGFTGYFTDPEGNMVGLWQTAPGG
jgi:predicted enzyme related to lactoylglutathione lyase